MYTLEGVRSVANFITAYEESQWNRDSNFLICSVFFVSKGYLFDVYLCVHRAKARIFSICSTLIFTDDWNM